MCVKTTLWIGRLCVENSWGYRLGEEEECASLSGQYAPVWSVVYHSDLDLNPSLKTIVSFSALVMESDFIHPSPIKNRRLPPCRRFYFTDFLIIYMCLPNLWKQWKRFSWPKGAPLYFLSYCKIGVEWPSSAPKKGYVWTKARLINIIILYIK